MVKYKVNLSFKENGKSLNEIITNVVKIELEKRINMTCDILKKSYHPYTFIISNRMEK